MTCLLYSNEWTNSQNHHYLWCSSLSRHISTSSPAIISTMTSQNSSCPIYLNRLVDSVEAGDLVSTSTTLAIPVIEPEGPSVASTHLLLSADIADDGVGGRTGRGPQDCHHAFRHNLAHCKEDNSTVRGLWRVSVNHVFFWHKISSRCFIWVGATELELVLLEMEVNDIEPQMLLLNTDVVKGRRRVSGRSQIKRVTDSENPESENMNSFIEYSHGIGREIPPRLTNIFTTSPHPDPLTQEVHPIECIFPLEFWLSFIPTLDCDTERVL